MASPKTSLDECETSTKSDPPLATSSLATAARFKPSVGTWWRLPPKTRRETAQAEAQWNDQQGLVESMWWAGTTSQASSTSSSRLASPKTSSEDCESSLDSCDDGHSEEHDQPKPTEEELINHYLEHVVGWHNITDESQLQHYQYEAQLAIGRWREAQ